MVRSALRLQFARPCPVIGRRGATTASERRPLKRAGGRRDRGRRGRGSACKPGSVRTDRSARDGHSSGTIVADRLEQPTRATGLKTALSTKLVSPLFGFAPGGVCPAATVAGRAVRSYRTFSPLPRSRPGRFVLCGTFPGVAPAGCCPAPCLHGARTFLDPEGPRPSGRPAPFGNRCAGRRMQARRDGRDQPARARMTLAFSQ